MRGLDRHEEREIVQPARVLAAEAIEAFARRGGSRRIEPIEHARPQRPAVGQHEREVDVAGGERLLAGCLRRREQPLLDQVIEADEQRVARER